MRISDWSSAVCSSDLDAAAVILEADVQAPATGRDLEQDAALLGLAGDEPLRRRLDAMTDRIAQRMHDRVAQLLTYRRPGERRGGTARDRALGFRCPPYNQQKKTNKIKMNT